MKARYHSLRPFLLWRSLERPPDWDQIFDRSAPLEVEIGFGNGEYLADYARQHPDANLVGIEERWASVRRGLARIGRAGTGNVRLLQVDVRSALQFLFPERSIRRVFSLFPCPWRKDKHEKHRLFARAFLELLAHRMQDGGELRVVTDWEPYLHWILGQVPECWRVEWRRVQPSYDTKYERKWLGQGKDWFAELRLEKRLHPAIEIAEELEMRMRQVARFDPAAPLVDVRGEVAVSFKDQLYDPHQERALLRAVVAEEQLVQNLWIEVLRRPDTGTWTIRPAAGCGMVPTRGIQEALDALWRAHGGCEEGEGKL